MESTNQNQSTNFQQSKEILLSSSDLPLITDAVRYGGEVGVVDAELSFQSTYVEWAAIMLAAAGVGTNEAVEILEGLCQVLVTTPLGPRQDEQLVQNPPLSPASTPPSPNFSPYFVYVNILISKTTTNAPTKGRQTAPSRSIGAAGLPPPHKCTYGFQLPRETS